MELIPGRSCTGHDVRWKERKATCLQGKASKTRLEVCTDVLQATRYDRVASDGDGDKRNWGKYKGFWLPIVKC